jgi:Cu/Ag efflux protein CusF
MICGPTPTSEPSIGSGRPVSTRSLSHRPFAILLFVVLLAAFAAGIWGTVIRPAAYEVRGTIVGRPAPDMILVRHEAVSALGMNAMDLMAVSASPALLDPVVLKTGDRVRLAVRQVNDQLVLIRIEKLP